MIRSRRRRCQLDRWLHFWFLSILVAFLLLLVLPLTLIVWSHTP